jgi:hypothetical protein
LIWCPNTGRETPLFTTEETNETNLKQAVGTIIISEIWGHDATQYQRQATQQANRFCSPHWQAGDIFKRSHGLLVVTC